jgi:hypothetical protein
VPDDNTPKWLRDWNELQPSLEGEGIIPTNDADQKEPRAEKENGPREDGKSQSIPDALAAINSTLTDQSEADRREERREDTGNKWLQGLTLAFVIATTIGIFWQASIFNDQLTEMKSASLQTKQLIETNAKLAEIASQQAAAAVKQAEATDKEANAMGQNAQAAHDNMIASQRAWLGPLTATINSVQKDKGLEGVVQYQNTGKEPAVDVLPGVAGKTYSLDQWNNGTAIQDINSEANSCLAFTDLPRGLGVAYPNIGFSTYQIHFDTSKGPNPTMVTDDMIAGQTVFKVQGCFAYRTVGGVHHSSFCYYYLANFTTLPNLNICSVGSTAD